MADSNICEMQNPELHVQTCPSRGLEKEQQHVALKQAGDFNSKQCSSFLRNSELGQTNGWCGSEDHAELQDTWGDLEGTGLWDDTLVPLKESEAA